MKRVLIFSTTYFPFVGGAEIAVKEITDRLPAVQFDMITLRLDSRMPKFERFGNVNVHRVGFAKNNPSDKDLLKFPLKLNKLLFPILALITASKLHKQRKYHSIWSIMAAFAGFAAMFFKSTHSEVKYLLTLQEGDPIDSIKKKARFVYPLFKKIFTKADQVQAISNHLATFAKDMGHKGQISVIPNAVDFETFSRKTPDNEKRVLRISIGIKDQDVLLVHTGRLVLKNGVEDIIKSLRYLPENIKFLSIGAGPDLEKLGNLAMESNVNNRVIFHDFIYNHDLIKFLNTSDIFIRPSLSEGLGNSFLEAMASGLPVIATEVGGIPDFLSDPEKNPDQKPTGLFVQVNDPKDIAKKVQVYLNNPELKEKITTNAREMIKEKYDWNIIAEKMRDVM